MVFCIHQKKAHRQFGFPIRVISNLYIFLIIITGYGTNLRANSSLLVPLFVRKKSTKAVRNISCMNFFCFTRMQS